MLSLFACNQTQEANTSTDTNAASAKKVASDFESPLPKLANIIAECTKVEYMLYDYGISFESPTPGDAGRFYSYLLNEAADESKCRKGQHDGGVVFKDDEGDIKMSMEINIFKECNRAVFEIQGKRYALPISDRGKAFFQQVMNMQQ
ncbi:MAG: hypothetical protein ACPGXL_05755 [Chitinophagales bacterium]